MRRILLSLTVLGLFSCGENSSEKKEENSRVSAPASTQNAKKSIPSETREQIGNMEVRINYHSPGVRGRKIWGGLVPYEEVWVTGAHKATSLEVNTPFKMGNQTIPAGKYALFTIPGREEWTVIINRNWDQHLADDYSEKEDVVRFRVKPEWKEESKERLTYEIEKAGGRSGTIVIGWEKMRLPIGIEEAE